MYTHKTISRALMFFAVLLLCFQSTPGNAREVTIRIVGNGGNAKYIEEGSTTEQPVEVQIGDTVVWVNQGNRTHTATAEDDDGDPLFDTGDIDPGDQSDPKEMTADMFAAAGGHTGQPVEIEYFCDIHSQMDSSLVLSEAKRSRRSKRADKSGPPRNELKSIQERRDITKLSDSELQQYRDAWREFVNSGEFARIAGYHGCPRGYCHRTGEQVIFLPWHREYLIRLEAALGTPLHYWDWTSSDSISSGIPSEFTDLYYTSADGSTYPNPLHSFRFSCPSGSPYQTTSRSPDSPSLLRQYASQVRTAYRAQSYRSFNSQIESPPHDNLHGWVGKQMSNTRYAAYDPIFWAHHSNVDRQWASWQRAGGPDPSSSDLSRSLTGFSGRTVNDVKDTLSLSYEYDRYDTVTTPPPFKLAADTAVTKSKSTSAKSTGVGKTFQIDFVMNKNEAVAGKQAEGVELLVSGIPEHPRDSYFVYVFVNQPDATPDDAVLSNPHFAGTFAVFGGHTETSDTPDEKHGSEKDRAVLTLFEGFDKKLPERITQLTLVTVDQTKTVIAVADVPFKSVTLQSQSEDAASEIGSEQPPAGSNTFTGVSENEDFDEAYSNAVDKAQKKLGSGTADTLVHVKVLSIEGVRGGIDGRRRMQVTIAAWVE